MAFGDALDNLRSWSDALSDRERRLLGAMAVVCCRHQWHLFAIGRREQLRAFQEELCSTSQRRCQSTFLPLAE